MTEQLDRRCVLRNRIKAILEDHPDGLSVSEIMPMLPGAPHAGSVRQSLLSLPSAYVDRWCKGQHGPYKAIWCLSDKCMVDCPKPGK